VNLCGLLVFVWRRVTFAAACVRCAAVYVVPWWFWCVVGACLAWGVGACAAGRSSGGGVVVGFDVGAVPRVAGEVVSGVSGFLPEPWASVGIGLGSLLGGGAVYGIGRRAAHAERDRADAEWLDGQRASGSGSGSRPPSGA
jgi:hypothetical protein